MTTKKSLRLIIEKHGWSPDNWPFSLQQELKSTAEEIYVENCLTQYPSIKSLGKPADLDRSKRGDHEIVYNIRTYLIETRSQRDGKVETRYRDRANRKLRNGIILENIIYRPFGETDAFSVVMPDQSIKWIPADSIPSISTKQARMQCGDNCAFLMHSSFQLDLVESFDNPIELLDFLEKNPLQIAPISHDPFAFLYKND